MGYNDGVSPTATEEDSQRMIKVISLVYRKKGISNKQFLSYWLDKHGPLAVENIPGVLHYTQNHPILSPGTDDDADGITEMWFEDMDAYNDYMEWRDSDDALIMKDSEDKFLDEPRTRRYLVEEHVFKKVGVSGQVARLG
ncbi:MAG: EthD family reductase [Dehalococcoidia bacterium]|nr:EthD family reductase [Dehalococcoidia bacterium]